MKVRHGDGVAIHTKPEPCVVFRKGGREASVGEHIGQPLSPAKIYFPGADAVAKVEGDTVGRANASARTARRGRRTWHVWKLVGREPGDPTFGQSANCGLVRIGKACLGPRVKDAGFGEKVIGQPSDPVPGHPILLTASPKRAPPKFGDVMTERI